jgi:hypothetical protein
MTSSQKSLLNSKDKMLRLLRIPNILNSRQTVIEIALETGDLNAETSAVIAGRFARLMLPKIQGYERLMSADSSRTTEYEPTQPYTKNAIAKAQANTEEFRRVMVSHQGNIESTLFELLRATGNEAEVDNFVRVVGGNGMQELAEVNPVLDSSNKITGFTRVFTLDSGDGKYLYQMTIPEGVLESMAGYPEVASKQKSR